MAGGSSVTPVRYDLAQFAQVSRVINSTSFVAGGLAGFDSGTFVGYSVWVLSKANKSSTAPKGELAKLISGFLGTGTQYPQLPGTITHDAFSAPLVVGDSVLLMHPAMASVTGMAGIVDGVCFNPVEGSPGTDWPVGTAGVPSNNLPDALTIMRDRDLRKIVLVGARNLTGFHTGPNDPVVMTDAAADPFKPGSLVGLTINNSTDGSTGVITANTTNTITVAALVGGGANIWTTGDAYAVVDALGNQPYVLHLTTNIHLNVVGNGLYDVNIDPGLAVWLTGGLVCRILTTGAGGQLFIVGPTDISLDADCEGDVSITEDCLIGAYLNYNGVAGFAVGGSLRVGVDLNNTSTGTVQIMVGGAKVGGAVNNSGGGLVEIFGDLQVGTFMTNSAASLVNVFGKLDINGDAGVGEGYLDNTDGAAVVVGGDCFVAGTITNTTGPIGVFGKLSAGSIVASDVGTIDIGAGAFVKADITNATGNISINGNLFSGSIIQNDPTSAGSVQVSGSVSTSNIENDGGSIQVGRDLQAQSIEIIQDNIAIGGNCVLSSSIVNSGAGTLTVNGDCKVGTHITNSGGGAINIYGKLDINGDPDAGEGYLDNTGGVIIFVGNDCHVAGDVFNTTGDIYIYGDLQVGYGIANTDAGIISIHGNCQVANSVDNTGGGNITIQGKLDTFGNLDNTGGNLIEVRSDAYIAGDLSNPAAIITIQGILRCMGSINNGGTLTTGPLECGGELENNGADPVTILGDCQAAARVTNSGGGDITIHGKLAVTGVPSEGEGNLNNAGGGDINIEGDCHVANDVISDGATGITIDGDLFAGGNIATNDTCLILVRGNVRAQTIQQVDTPTVTIQGDCLIVAGIDNPAGAQITVAGVLRCLDVITNAGTLEYMGVYPEQPISEAVNVAPVDIINLASTTKRYTIDSLVLKCTDPGINTITVRLYKIVNAASVEVDSFDITTATFTTYFTMMDMFGIPVLAGDSIILSIECNAGGPYDVVGSYTVRTDTGGTAGGGVIPPS